MKRIPGIITLMLLSLVSYTQIPKPGKPIFMVTYEENGKSVNGSWTYTATVKFSLSHYYENTPWYMPFDPVAFLKRQPDELGSKVNFYPSEIDESGSGSGASYTRKLTPDNVEIIKETTSDGTRTIVITDADYRSEHGISPDKDFPTNARFFTSEQAVLERTATGAILYAYTAVGNNLLDWAVGDEVMEQVFPKVVTFVLTDQDIRSWQQISRTNIVSGSYDDDRLTVKLSVKMEIPDAEKPEVTIDGCSQFGNGEHGNVIASAKPDGGNYEFRVEPSDLMSVDASGASATLTGSRLGRGNIYVKYTTPDGAVGESSQPASVVALYSYNNANPIPQIVFFDVEGKKKTDAITIPYSADPENSNELLDFVPGDATIINLIPSSGSIEIKGLKPGKTTLEAKDNCGNIVGPTVEVEVVNCDDESVARIEKQRQAAAENLQIAAGELQKIAGSPEFEKARDDLVLSTIDLLAKTALTIIAGGDPESAVVKSAAKIADSAAGLSDMLDSGSHEEVFFNGVKAAAGNIWGETVGTLIGLGEVAFAADRFYKNCIEIQLQKENLKSAWESYEKALKPLEDALRRQQICKGEKTQPQKQEKTKADQPPKPDDPVQTPKDPDPTQKPKSGKEQPTANEPGDKPVTEEPGKQEPPDNPPPTSEPPSQVGLPYEPGDCGCEKQQGIGLNSAGLAALDAGINNLSDCVDRFNKTSLADYTNALNELSELAKSLQSGAGDNPEIFLLKAKETKPQLDSLILRVRTYDEAGKTFLGEFEKCPDSVKAGMDVLESALTVTVDSIKTKY